jgi:hypothetical protein
MHGGRRIGAVRSVPFIGRVMWVTKANQATAKFKLGHQGSKQASTVWYEWKRPPTEAAVRG